VNYLLNTAAPIIHYDVLLRPAFIILKEDSKVWFRNEDDEQNRVGFIDFLWIDFLILFPEPISREWN